MNDYAQAALLLSIFLALTMGIVGLLIFSVKAFIALMGLGMLIALYLSALSFVRS